MSHNSVRFFCGQDWGYVLQSIFEGVHVEDLEEMAEMVHTPNGGPMKCCLARHGSGEKEWVRGTPSRAQWGDLDENENRMFQV